MTDTQQKLYDLLVKFDRCCRDNGVVYYLGSGSALGAVRHAGFLPWDDDVDLYITRDNYNKLLANKDKFFDNEFVLVNTDEFPRYRNTLVRMVDTNSTVITRVRIVDGTPKGQFLELFILDPMPRDKSTHNDWFKKQWVYTELLSTLYQLANSRNENVDEELYYHYKQRAESEGYDVVLNELSNQLFSVPEAEADQYSLRWGFRNLLYDINWFGEPRYVPFEDIELPVAHCAESILRVEYGDSWMYIPTADEQMTHFNASSMSVAFKEITDCYESELDLDSLYETYTKYKDVIMKDYFAKQEIAKKLIPFKQAQVDCSIELNTKRYPDINKKYLKGDLDTVRAFFKTYYDIQCGTQCLKWRRFIKISDEHLCMALAPILVDGNFSRVKFILSLRERQGELSKDLMVLKNFVESLTKIYSFIDYRDFKNAKSELDRINEIGFLFCDIQFNVQILRLKFMLDDCNEDNILTLVEKLMELLSKYDNAEIKYLIAEAYYKQNDFEAAEKWYLESKKNLRHGFVLIHLNERLKSIEEGKQ